MNVFLLELFCQLETVTFNAVCPSLLEHRSSSWTWRTNNHHLCHFPAFHTKSLRIRPLLDSPEKLCSLLAFFPPKKSLPCLPPPAGKAPCPRLTVLLSKRLLARCHMLSRRDLHSCILPPLSKTHTTRYPWLPKKKPSTLLQLLVRGPLSFPTPSNIRKLHPTLLRFLRKTR